MKYTIQDLSEGKVALHYNIDDIKLLCKILKLAFPTDYTIPGGVAYYYKRNSNDGFWGSSYNSYNISVPIQNINDFELPYEFKWGDKILVGGNKNYKAKFIGILPDHPGNCVVVYDTGSIAINALNIIKPYIEPLPQVELTIEEIAAMMHLKPEQIRIKDK